MADAQNEPARSEIVQPRDGGTGEPARIVVVTQDADLRLRLAGVLATRFEIRVEADTGRALDSCHVWRPDALLADASVPGPEGETIFAALRAGLIWQKTPILMLVDSHDQALATTLDAGADDCLVMPFGDHELLARLNAIIRRRRHLGEALDAGRARLDMALAAARMITWEWNAAEGTVTATGSLYELAGLRRIDTTAQVLALMDPDDAARHVETIQRAMESGTTYQSEFRIVHRVTGKTVWLEEHGMALADGAGNVQRVVAIVMDSTERKETLEQRYLLTQAGAVLAELPNEIAGLRRLARLLVPPFADWCAVALMREDGTIVWPAVLQPDASIARRLRRLLRLDSALQTAATNAVRKAMSGQARLIARVDDRLLRQVAGTKHLDFARSLGLQSALLIPLTAHHRHYGILLCGMAASGRLYTRRHLATASEIGWRAALAVENARLHATERRVADELQALQTVTDTALAHQSLDDLLEQLLQRVRDLLSVSTAVILLATSGRDLVVRAAVGVEPSEAQRVRVPFGRGIAGGIAQSRLPRIIDDIRAIEVMSEYLRYRIRSLMGVPLLVEGRLVGVLHVGSAEKRHFLPGDLDLLQHVGDRVAVAIDRAQTHTDALRARDLVVRLHRLAVALSAAAGVAEVADEALSAGMGVTGAQAGSVLLVRDGSESLDIVAAKGFDDIGLDAWLRISIDEALPLADALIRRQPVMLESSTAWQAGYPSVAEEVSSLPYQALAAVPLIAGDSVLGVLAFNFTAPHSFDLDGRTFLEAVAHQCAQALDRARLYDAERQARAAAVAELRRLQQVLDALPEAVLVTGDGARFVLGNRVASSILGIDLAGTSVPLNVASPYPANLPRRIDGTPYDARDIPLHRSLLSGEDVHGEQMLIRNAASKRDIPVLANATPLCDQNGRIVGAMMVFQDITQIKDLEREREAFLASVSHDLKTPLTVIAGQGQLLMRRIRDASEPDIARVVQGVQAILQATTRLSAQISELVDIGRIQLGQPLELERQLQDLAELVERLVREHDGALEQYSLHLESAVSALPVDIDVLRLERVIANLLDNATKYSPVGSTITIRVGRRLDEVGPWAYVSVADQGIGIPMEELPRVFERFYRASNSRPIATGSGLGLAGVRQVVEAHGGSVQIESEEGTGTTVTVHLPLAASAIQEDVTDAVPQEARHE